MDRWLVVVVLAGCSGGATGVPDAGRRDARPAELAEIHRIGRFDADDRFAFPGSQLRTRFSGTTLSVQLDDPGANTFDVAIDGVVTDLVSGTGVHVLATGLAAGEHDVTLTRRSESFFGITRFLGFSGAPLVATTAPTRRIELVGDSITCGYGVLGTMASCAFSIDTEAETHAWGALAAAELGAAHTVIAYSGKGVYRNYGGNTVDPMPVIFERTFADDAASTWTFDTPAPDAVVIALGTNDFSSGDPGQAFVDASLGLVAQIRGHYPDAWILLAESPMLGGVAHAAHAAHLATVAAGAGGLPARISTLAIPVQDDADGYGCDYHPNEVTQQKMATALAAELRARLDW